LRQLGRERAGCDQSRGAGRLAGTSNNAPARVIGVHDQSETGSLTAERSRILRGHTEQQQGAAGREPHGAHAVSAGKPGKPGKRVAVNMSKRQGNTDRHRAVLQPMSADHLCRRAPWCSRRALEMIAND
jgi:hypothetical protein